VAGTQDRRAVDDEAQDDALEEFLS
jgi:hypothetical protein